MIAATLKKSYEDAGVQVELLDIFGEYNRVLNAAMEKLYLLSYKPAFKKFYGKIYYAGAHRVAGQGDAFYGLFKNTVVDMVEDLRPHLILNTYSHRTVPIYKRAHYPDISVLNLITEYCVPAYWVHPDVDHYYVASAATAARLRAAGARADTITVTGIPVREAFRQPQDTAYLLQKYALSPHKTTAILFAGTYGVLTQLTTLCTGLDRMDDLQTVVVCGKNHRLYEKLRRRRYKNLKILRYIPNIHELYALGDFMITKPGGTVLSEIAATGMPVILYDPVPGQEAENALIFSAAGAARIAEDPQALLRHVHDLKAHPEARARLTKNLASLGDGAAAGRIVRDSLTRIKKR